jgi:hypothetical protein
MNLENARDEKKLIVSLSEGLTVTTSNNIVLEAKMMELIAELDQHRSESAIRDAILSKKRKLDSEGSDTGKWF